MALLTWLNETFSLPAVVACTGALISASGAIWASYEQTKSQAVAEKQTKKIEELNHKILLLSEENKDLAKEGISSVTGGDGFVWIDITKGFFTDAYAPYISSKGKYPQYDISIRFYDESKDHQQQIWHPLTLNIATLPPGQGRVEKIPAFDLSDKVDYAKFNIFIHARNGSYVENIRLRKVENEWYSALRVYKLKQDGSQILLFEEAMAEFPKSAEGKPLW